MKKLTNEETEPLRESALFCPHNYFWELEFEPRWSDSRVISTTLPDGFFCCLETISSKYVFRLLYGLASNTCLTLSHRTITVSISVLMNVEVSLPRAVLSAYCDPCSSNNIVRVEVHSSQFPEHWADPLQGNLQRFELLSQPPEHLGIWAVVVLCCFLLIMEHTVTLSRI